MEFQIHPGSDSPIYRQLAAQIRHGVVTGKLQIGEQLPSVREMSKALIVNPNTIARAYLELEREGVVHARPGVGVFIAPPQNQLAKPVRKKLLSEKLDHLLVEAIYLGFRPDEVAKLLEERSQRLDWDVGQDA